MLIINTYLTYPIIKDLDLSKIENINFYYNIIFNSKESAIINIFLFSLTCFFYILLLIKLCRYDRKLVNWSAFYNLKLHNYKKYLTSVQNNNNSDYLLNNSKLLNINKNSLIYLNNTDNNSYKSNNIDWVLIK